MSDDWRLRVDLHEDGPAHALTEHLGQSALEHDLDTSFHDRVVVSREGTGVFCYTGTREQAQKAETLVHALAANLDWHVDAELTRWHPSPEEWKDAGEPLSQADLDVERDAESAAIVMREREALEERGHPEFEVRVQCPSHHGAVQLLETLRREGLSCVRRSSCLLIGAPDEEIADALVQRLGQEAPARGIVITKGALRAASTGRSVNPFSVLVGSSPEPGSTPLPGSATLGVEARADAAPSVEESRRHEVVAASARDDRWPDGGPTGRAHGRPS